MAPYTFINCLACCWCFTGALGPHRYFQTRLTPCCGAVISRKNLPATRYSLELVNCSGLLQILDWNKNRLYENAGGSCQITTIDLPIAQQLYDLLKLNEWMSISLSRLWCQQKLFVSYCTHIYSCRHSYQHLHTEWDQFYRVSSPSLFGHAEINNVA